MKKLLVAVFALSLAAGGYARFNPSHPAPPVANPSMDPFPTCPPPGQACVLEQKK